MRPFRDLPIARKTLTLGLVPAILALIVAILASLLSTYMTARRIQEADVESQATVVADNTGAGLAFGDRIGLCGPAFALPKSDQGSTGEAGKIA